MRFIERQNTEEEQEEETTRTEDQISNESTGPGFWSAGSGAGARDQATIFLFLFTVYSVCTNQSCHLL